MIEEVGVGDDARIHPREVADMPGPRWRWNEELAAIGVRRQGDAWMLAEVKVGNVTQHGRSFRVWFSESECELATKQVRRLLADGLVAVEHTYTGRGIVRLTNVGEEALHGR